ncbi:MAG: nucleotide exchange factor GrpE [Holophagales bacterium]|nr:nucleotide exchange factor GrpE [Holophagales bacterium]
MRDRETKSDIESAENADAGGNGAERRDPEDRDAYELDLDSESQTRVEDLLEDALEAVQSRERGRKGDDGGEDAGAENGSTGDEASSGGAEEAARLQDRLTRTMADFTNFRKRTEREKEELRRFAAGEVIKELLAVIDNLERAVDASGSIEELKEGLNLVLKQQADILKRWGVSPVEAVGRVFDPKVHEAVARAESTEVDQPTVTGELQKGYTIHGRLLRPAMVQVTMPAAASANGDGGEMDEAGHLSRPGAGDQAN